MMMIYHWSKSIMLSLYATECALVLFLPIVCIKSTISTQIVG